MWNRTLILSCGSDRLGSHGRHPASVFEHPSHCNPGGKGIGHGR
jgi:hypothetical protein